MNWEVKSLRELEDVGIIQLGRGKIISKKDLAASPGDFPVYSSSKVGDGKFGEYGLYMFDEELITWSVDGGGRLFHRAKHKFSITNVTGFLRILDNSVLSYKYLYYALSLLHSKINFDWVKKAHPSVLRKEYKQIPVPPLAEQQRIVAKLDAAFAEIDRAIEVAESKHTEVEKLKAALLSSLLRGEDWETVKLGELCINYKSDIVDGPFGANLKSEHFQSEGIPVLKIQNVKEFALNKKKMVYVSKEKYAELSRHNFRNGDLIMTKLGAPLGVTAIVNDLKEGVIVADLVRIRIDETKADKQFMEYQLNSPSIRNQINSAAKGATRPRINLSVVRTLKLQIPPLTEQQRIVAKLDAAFAELDRAQASVSETKAHYQALKSAILAQELQPPQSKAA